MQTIAERDIFEHLWQMKHHLCAIGDIQRSNKCDLSAAEHAVIDALYKAVLDACEALS